jgi:hypothetical protein
MLTRTNRRAAAVIGMVGALLLVAFAAQADAATINACVAAKSGATRVVSSKAKCKKGEKKLSWGTQGLAGKNGANGANGAAGIQGPQGPQGPAGAAVKLNFRANYGAPTVSLYDSHGLSIAAQCTKESSSSNPDLRADATTNNNSIKVQEFNDGSTISGGNPKGLTGVVSGTPANTPFSYADVIFDQSQADGVALVWPGPGSEELWGNLEFAGSDGSNVSLQYFANIFEGAPAGDCVISGNLLQT